MQGEPRPFTLGQIELAQMLGENGWCNGLRRITFAKDPGWIGFVRMDGTGLALENPSYLELFTLRQSMAIEVLSPADETSPWAV